MAGKLLLPAAEVGDLLRGLEVDAQAIDERGVIVVRNAPHVPIIAQVAVFSATESRISPSKGAPCPVMGNQDQDAGDRLAATVVIADDNALLVDTLVATMAPIADIDVIATALDGDGLLAAVAEHAPDVVLMDLRLGSRWGLDLVPELRAGPTPPAIVVFSAAIDPAVRAEGERAGVFSLLTKGASLQEVRQAVADAAASRSD